MRTRFCSGAVLFIVLGLIMAGCATTMDITPPHRGQPRHDGKPRINNVGRRPWLESMIVGQNRAIIASPAFNQCKPLQLQSVACKT
jgi:hypothetical protein